MVLVIFHSKYQTGTKIAILNICYYYRLCFNLRTFHTISGEDEIVFLTHSLIEREREGEMMMKKFRIPRHELYHVCFPEKGREGVIKKREEIYISSRITLSLSFFIFFLFSQLKGGKKVEKYKRKFLLLKKEEMERKKKIYLFSCREKERKENDHVQGTSLPWSVDSGSSSFFFSSFLLLFLFSPSLLPSLFFFISLHSSPFSVSFSRRELSYSLDSS